MSEAEFLSGRLLLALPGMADPNFERSVIAMYAHDENGALGIGVGHLRSGIRFHQVLRELDIEPGRAPDCPVHHGGPVEPGHGFVLHSCDWAADGTLEVPSLGGLTTSIEILHAIAAGTGPRQWIMALGYAGWGAGQLDGEMKRHGWYAAEGRPEILYETPAEMRWAATWHAEGIDPAHLSGATGRA